MNHMQIIHELSLVAPNLDHHLDKYLDNDIPLTGVTINGIYV